jgi:predicted SAM-dependent methyltransferase
MKLYLGSRDLKPEGFLSVDIDPSYHPDICADITDMNSIEDGSCSEIIASHVLEHLEWPDSFLAMAEMSRVTRIGGKVRIAVPDLLSLLNLMFTESPYAAMGMIYGSGGKDNPFERHRYGFTAFMLIEILSALGYGDFNWWGSCRPEGANGWLPSAGVKMGISLNVEGVKKTVCPFPVKKIYDRLCESRMEPFGKVLAECADLSEPLPDIPQLAAALYQKIHFQLIDARQRIEYLEHQVSKLENGKTKLD